jgi:hypothetical protein
MAQDFFGKWLPVGMPENGMVPKPNLAGRRIPITYDSSLLLFNTRRLLSPASVRIGDNFNYVDGVLRNLLP